MMKKANLPAATADLPQWHNYPMLLTLTEIATPATVLTGFFSCFPLPDLRACMNLWLTDALEGNAEGAAATVRLHNDVVRALEAAWLLVQKK